jgi:hypothetical protein
MDEAADSHIRGGDVRVSLGSGDREHGVESGISTLILSLSPASGCPGVLDRPVIPQTPYGVSPDSLPDNPVLRIHPCILVHVF